MDTATENHPEFVIVEQEHDDCKRCAGAAEAAASHAKATGSTGGTWIEDGLHEQHRAVVTRAEEPTA